jgi:hypothetical protein
MALSKRKKFGLKIALMLVVLFFACLWVFSHFLTRIDEKMEAIEMVKAQHLQKERIEGFVSNVNREGKFKLIGWDIEPTEKKRVFIVSYTLRRLNEDGFATGPVEGFWYKVDLKENSCEQIFPPGTSTPES